MPSPVPTPSPAPPPAGGAAVPAAPPFPPIAISADADRRGLFTPLADWPLIAAHAVLLVDGRVLTYGTDGRGRQTAYFIYDVWDPKAGLGGGHLTLPNGTQVDLFCGAQLVLPGSGSVVMMGGDNWTGTRTTNTGNAQSAVFDPAANALSRARDLNLPRWYGTATTLRDGSTYLQGGLEGRRRPELRGADGVFRLLEGADTAELSYWYPRNFVAPDGERVFGIESNGRMYYVDPRNGGSVSKLGRLAVEAASYLASTVMFRPGRILHVGGVSNQATLIDIRAGGDPVVTPARRMSTVRAWPTATVLPNGQVLVNGGSEVENKLVGVSLHAEIWDPDSGEWQRGASGAVARMYHSTALLLPDGSVLVAGGGAPGPLVNLNAQLYYPPYFFAPGGQLAARPQLRRAPIAVDPGRAFELSVADAAAIRRVTLVRTGSVTHSWDMSQRFIELSFAAGAADVLTVQGPRAADAPPGFYMLFVIDAAGRTSMGAMLRINVVEAGNG